MKKTGILMIIVMLLAGAVIAGVFLLNKKEPVKEDDPIEETTPEISPNSGVTVQENEGDIIIEIPEDMDSDGF